MAAPPPQHQQQQQGSPMEDQARLLEDALIAVRQQTSLMRKCLDTPGKLMDALKCCSNLVSELRTGSLGPKQYYELYMAVFDALRHLSVHLRENHPVNHLADLYELVQYAGNIVPRLYLMITVGTAYMSVPAAPVKELMKDMMDMSRGVQHPVRGLFLRYYLAGQARDCLPTGSDDGSSGGLADSINFVLTNFVEMNKLWVRLQHQGHSRERDQRTRERRELQLLIGSNIERLSRLVDLDTYRTKILGPLLDQVVHCRDVLAQEYLLEVITQVFPDEFHLHTLDQFLGAVSRLNPHVNVKAIVVGMMDRLSEYAEREGRSVGGGVAAAGSGGGIEGGPAAAAAAGVGEDKAKAEEESLAKLLENTRLRKEGRETAATAEPVQVAAEDGTNGRGSGQEEEEDGDGVAATGDSNRISLLAETESGGGQDGEQEQQQQDQEQQQNEQDSQNQQDPQQDRQQDPQQDQQQDQQEQDQQQQQGNEQQQQDQQPPPQQQQSGIPPNVRLYEVFFARVRNLVEAQHLPIQDTVALLVSLANLALNIYPDRLEYVDQILEYANGKVRANLNSADLHSQPAQQSLLALLRAPIRHYASLFTALSLPTFVPLLQGQSYPTRRALAGDVARALLQGTPQTYIATEADLANVLEVLKVLIREGSQQQPPPPPPPPHPHPHPQGPPQQPQSHKRITASTETDDTAEEQGWLARIVHLVRSPDDETQFRLLQTLRQAYADGGDRIRTTTPALITVSIRLARRLKMREQQQQQTQKRSGGKDDSADGGAGSSSSGGANWETQSRALYKFMHSALVALYTRVGGPAAAELSLRLFCACGQTADAAGFEEVAYEFFAQAFTVYEEAVSDSRAQFQAVCAIASSLHQTSRFGRENYDTLITKCAQHGSRLLRKPDQCRAVYLASHLWWATARNSSSSSGGGGGATATTATIPFDAPGEEDKKNGEEGALGGGSVEPQQELLYRDGKRVLECLQRALRVADSCMETATTIELFVEILDRYVYYFDQQNEAITIKYVNGLIELIHSNLAGSQHESAAVESSRKHFYQTLENIRARQYDGVVLYPQR